MKRRFVVDSNIGEWKEWSAHPKNQNTAFILGTTVTKEAQSLRRLFLDRHDSPIVRNNVFFFAWNEPTPDDVRIGERKPFLRIFALDEACAKITDFDGMARFDSLDKKSRRRETDASGSIGDEKQRILQELNISSVSELDQPKDWTSKISELHAKIETARLKCYSRFWESNDAARYAYALLLLAPQRLAKKTRKEFCDAKNANVLGDEHLVQNALFFGAEILSQDNAVHFMAKACGIGCASILNMEE
jgi:hypothetical protein